MSGRGTRVEIARVTIELTSPLVIGGCDGSDIVDIACVRDANGLPTLPGTSLAGVLRHDIARSTPQVASAFGWQEGNEGEASSVVVSWGQVHDRLDCPVPFLVLDGLPDDPVLTAVQEGVIRDHVRLNHRGTADKAGKFDERLVPRGTRFTFELRVEGNSSVSMGDLLGRLGRPDLRLGGRTRAGLGAFEVVRASGRSFDLSVVEDREALSKLPRALHEAVPQGVLPPLTLHPTGGETRRTYVVVAEPVDLWAIGGGDPVLKREHYRSEGKDESARPRDLLPMTEVVIRWRSGRGEVERAHVVPGSSLKGVLRHRVAFHARRLVGAIVPVSALDDPANLDLAPGTLPPTDKAAEERAVYLETALFGEARGNDDSADGTTAGRVLPEDVYLEEVTYGATQHVSIDRFTQAPMDGRLFDAAPLHGSALSWRVAVSLGDKDGGELAQRALEAALDDLCAGRLALGAASGRGFGFLKGSWHAEGGSWAIEEGR